MAMAVSSSSSKILIFGGTGEHIGRYMVKASIGLGHPTYVYSRRPNSSTKTDLLEEFKSLGVIVVQGELDEHDKLVSALKEVDVVISLLPYPQIFDQLKIIEAIKVAGNIKRFIPSDFGVEEHKVSDDVILRPLQIYLEDKRKIERATEAAGIPYNFVSANVFGALMVDYLLHPREQQSEDITVYGTGETKFILNYEEDIAMYTIKVATDPRTANHYVIYRPPANYISQLEFLSLWEKKTGRSFKRVHVSEEEIVSRAETLPHPEDLYAAILHCLFIKGVPINLDLQENELEASRLYPDVQLTTVDRLFDKFLSN